VAGGASILFAVDALALKLAGVMLVSVGAIVVLRIPTCTCADTIK
jgi:hypothetical protein